MKEAYRGYKTMDEESKQQFMACTDFVQLFSQPNPDFTRFTNVPGLAEFVAANKGDMDNLAKHVKVVEQIMNKFIDPAQKQLIGILDEVDVNKETQKIVMRERKQSEIFDDINNKFGDKFSDFEDKVSKTSQSIDKLRNIAVGLNAKGCPIQANNAGVDALVAALAFLLVSFLVMIENSSKKLKK